MYDLQSTSEWEMEVVLTPKFSVFTAFGKDGPEDLFASKLKSKWLSDRLYAVSHGAAHIDFNSPRVKEQLEPHLEVCRQQRHLALEKRVGNSVTLEKVQRVLGSVTKEDIQHFDMRTFRLRDLFMQALAGSDDEAKGIELEQIHRLGYPGKGKRKNRNEKRRLVEPLTVPEKRAIFQGGSEGFDAFVLNFILPSLAKELPAESQFYYQAFPCVRIVRPGEFSIGVHADVAYGFSPAAVNFYVALTDVFGTASIAVESEPGKEDFRVANLRTGDVYRFHGSVCSHLTMENTTSVTRVSLDFRVIVGSLWEGNDERADHYSSTSGYFVRAEKNEKNEWVRTEPLPNPDARNGFPFTAK